MPIAKNAAPKAGEFEAWKATLRAELRRVSFRYFPETIPAAKKISDADALTERLESEEGVGFHLRFIGEKLPGPKNGMLLVVLGEEEAGTTPDWIKNVPSDGRAVVLCEPRGIGATKWTRKNGPNYVERSHALLGRTVDTGRVWDVIAAAKFLNVHYQSRPKIFVAGREGAGLIAAYAAALDDSIAGVTLIQPPATHMDSAAPQFLSVLRICDVPAALGLIAPRPLSIEGSPADALAATSAAYSAAGAGEKLTIK